jgi:hypothetical protein
MKRSHHVTAWGEISAWERLMEWLFPTRRRRRIARNRAEVNRIAGTQDEVKYR